MRRWVVYGILVGLTACGTSDQKATEDRKQAAPLALMAKSDAFNQSYNLLLSDYYRLKDDFIAEKDSAVINHSAKQMIVSADSLALDEMKADSSLIETARSFSAGISAELKGLTGETTMEGKRRSLQMVSDQLYDLSRTVHYSGAVIYHFYCPMAFSDQGAYWLSNSREVKNPYIPQKKIDCGSIRDSLDFRPDK